VQTEHTGGHHPGHDRQRVAMRPHAQPRPRSGEVEPALAIGAYGAGPDVAVRHRGPAHHMSVKARDFARRAPADPRSAPPHSS
jgi:hypothetical protein